MMMRNARFQGKFAAIAAIESALLTTLVGCGTAVTTGVPGVPATPHTSMLSGKVHGGQQPVVGSVIQLYAVGITGPKSAATALIATSITSANDGSFNLVGSWNCTSDTALYGTNPLLYLTASGGNPGLGSETDNAAIVLVTALGPCNGIGPETYIEVNELTTVAAAYALGPFAADAAHIGAQGANPVGLVNAFKTAALLVNPATGVAPGTLPANASAPAAELNTLGNILAGCVNSTGVGGGCAKLFTATKPAGAAATDVFTAALDIAANPGGQPPTLLGVATADAPFQPALTGPPADWTVALTFNGGGLNAPAGLALDAVGDVWVANASGNSVTELSNTGALLTGAAGYTGNKNILGAQGIAVDNAGNVWLADTLLSTVVKLSLSGGAVQGSTSYSAGGISGPMSLAIDSQNNVWVSNFAGGSVTELNSQGVPVGASPLTAGGLLQAPIGVAVDATGNVWIADNEAGDLVEFGNDQGLLSGAGYNDGAMLAPQAVALDASARAWIADNGNSAVSLFAANGGSLLAAPLMGGGLSLPTSVAVDGAGTVWLANGTTSGSVSEIVYGQAVVSPAAGLGVLNRPMAIAIDASGSIWSANAGDNSVSEIVGIAAPVVTPLAIHSGP
jgi:streptogramin lyase